MRHNLILLAIVVAALLMSGCCGLIPGSGTSQDNGNSQDSGQEAGDSQNATSQDLGDVQDNGTSDASPPSSVASSGLVGSWTNNQSRSDLSDPQAALESGVAGTWYTFYDDGTFDETVLTSGKDGGIMEYTGNYDVQGNAILQSGVSRSWYPQNDTQEPQSDIPVADAKVTFRILNNDTLELNGGGSGNTFYLVNVTDEDLWEESADALAG